MIISTEVLATPRGRRGEVEVFLRPKARRRGQCGRCGERATWLDNGGRARRWRHLDAGMVKVWIVAVARRVDCKACGPIVAAVPGRTDTGAPSGPYRETQPFRTGTVALTVTPNQPGTNSVHVDFLGSDGLPADLAQKVILELRLPDKGLGPLEREMLKGGVGHFFLEGISDLSIAGTWEITLNVRVSDFDQERVAFTDPLG